MQTADFCLCLRYYSVKFFRSIAMLTLQILFKQYANLRKLSLSAAGRRRKHLRLSYWCVDGTRRVRGKKRRRHFDDAEMQFVARQEVVAPCALPVSTSRYLQRLRSIVPSRGDKLPRCAAIAAIPPTCEGGKKTTETGTKKCVTNLSAIDIDRRRLESNHACDVLRKDVRERGRYLIDVALRFIITLALHVSCAINIALSMRSFSWAAGSTERFGKRGY